MPVFGGYETVGQLSPTPFGSVYKAKQAGSAAANFIIKTYSPLGIDAAELKRHPDVKKFLGSAELQKLVAASSQHWAPVHEMGISNEGAYYVSTFYPTSASRLIKGKTKLGSDDFYELTQAVLAGLSELQQCCRRSHGNLLPSSILLPRMDASGYGQAMLAEPLAADSTKAASEQGDLAALGRVLYELVMHKPYNVAGAWPIPDSPEWARMGKAGKGWKEFCNKLLSTDPADAMTLQGAQAELAKLKPKKAPVPIWAVAAAVLVLVIGGGVFSYFHFRPDPNFKDKWVQLVDAYPAWFRVFAEENLRSQLPAEYASARDLVDKAQKQKQLELDPQDLSGKRDIEEQKNNPPATRDGMNKAKEAFELAMAVQTQMMKNLGGTPPVGLEAKTLPDALVAKVESFVKEYQKRGWSAPAQELAKLTTAPPNEKGGDYVNRLLALLQALPALKGIESDWAVVEERQKQITDPADPILRQFPDFVRRAVYADADRDNVITTRDIARKLQDLRGDFDKDPAFWNSLGQFASGPWKNGIDKEALRKTSQLYLNPPTQLLEPHLRNWLSEAEQYGILPPQDNPASKPEFDALTKNAKDQFAMLMAYYNSKQQTPPADVMKLQENLNRTDVDVTSVKKLAWRSGTRPDVERGVADATKRLNELAEQINRAIEDTKRTDPATIDLLVQQLKTRSFTSTVTAARWEELKSKWTLNDVEKLRKDLTEPEKFKRFKESTRIAEDNLHTMEKSLADRLDLSSVQRKSEWNRNLVDVMKRLDDAEQRRLLQLSVNRMDLDQVMTVSANLQNEMDKFRDIYDGWRKEARQFVETANALEDHLDAGYGLLSEAAAKSPVAGLYQELTGSKFWQVGEVAIAVGPLAGRFETLKSLRSESRAPMLAEIVRKNAYPSMVLDAWQRLHSGDVNWPVTVEQLDFDREHRKTLSAAVGSRITSEQVANLVKRRQESLAAELEQQGPRSWRRFMVAARGAGEMEAALKRGLDADVMSDFGVDLAKVDPPLPAQVQFDIFLFRNKSKVLGLAEKDDKKAQEEVKRLLAALPEGDAAAKIRAGLMELTKDQGGGGGAVVDTGPMSKAIQERIQWQRRGTPEQPSFSWDGHVLTFVRLEGAVDGNGKKLPPYYLSTTEVTIGLFQALMGKVGTASELNLPKGDRNMNGPQLWERSGEALKLRDNWMRIHTQIFNDFAPSLSKGKLLLAQADANPMAAMPMQYVPPEAALAIAEAMGCRLPSSFEWEFAVKRPVTGPQPLPNLRDASWNAQLKHITGVVVDDGNIFAQYPDNGMFPYEGKYGRGKDASFWSAQGQQQFNLNIPAGYNDGYVYLRPVGDGSQLSDLIGNVSEMVFDAPAKLAKVEPTVAKLREVLEANQNDLFVVGGSCISPPEVGFARQPCGMHNGFADVGFRVAFEAANRLIVDRLKDLMNEQDYVAIAAAAPPRAN